MRERDVRPIIVGMLAVALGLLGILRCPDTLGIRASEALFIAGFLSLTVDLYLKAKLQRDAAKDIFHHLLGINLPSEIRETLRDAVFQNKRFIRNMQVDATAELINDRVRLRVIMDADVTAVTDTVYQTMLQFEEAERPEIAEVSLSCVTLPKLNFKQNAPPLKAKEDEPEVLEWRGKKVKLKAGDTVHTHSQITVMKDVHDFWVLNFGTPAIHARVRVYGDATLNVTASAADQLNGNEYFYKKVFVIGDHLQIRWKPKVP